MFLFKNVAGQKVEFVAFDITTGAKKSGDAANITAYVRKDHGTTTILNDTSATENESSNAKGCYTFDLTQAETNADQFTFTAKSSTANIELVPRFLSGVPPNFSGQVIDASGLVSLAPAQTFNQTGNMTGNITGNLVGNVTGNVAGSVASLTEYEAGTDVMTESYPALHAAPTRDQALFMILSMLMEKSASGSTLLGKRLDGSTTAMTFTMTLDGSGNPTAITRTA